MSIPPSWSRAAWTMAWTEASDAVSTMQTETSAPVSSATERAATWSAASSLAASITVQPSRASCRAQARPMPRDPPVTRARLPLSCRSMGGLLDAKRSIPRGGARCASGRSAAEQRLHGWRQAGPERVCHGDAAKAEALLEVLRKHEFAS